MGGRFGKYGDAKRKQRLQKARFRPPVPPQPGKGKPVKGPDKSGAKGPIHPRSSNKTEGSEKNASG